MSKEFSVNEAFFFLPTTHTHPHTRHVCRCSTHTYTRVHILMQHDTEHHYKQNDHCHFILNYNNYDAICVEVHNMTTTMHVS